MTILLSISATMSFGTTLQKVQIIYKKNYYLFDNTYTSKIQKIKMLAQIYEILYFFPIDLSWIDFRIYLCGAAGYTRSIIFEW